MSELQLKLASQFQDLKILEFIKKKVKQQAVAAAAMTSILQS